MNNGIGRIQRVVIVLLLSLPAPAWAMSAPDAGSSVKEPTSGKKTAPASERPAQSSTSAVPALGFEVAVSGGSLLPWDAPEETGNAFGCSASLLWSDFRAGLSYGTALPDSRSQGLYHSLWAELAWYFVGSIGTSHVQPYVVAGTGVAFGDDPPEVRLGDPETIRWNEETTFLGILGLGARYGLDTGLYVSVDVRAYSLTFGGYSLSAGYRF